MKTKVILAGIMLAAAATTAQAGGILTNTNQSIDFLRNPARDAAIGLDGVYSNPAGVAFLPQPKVQGTYYHNGKRVIVK